MSVNLCDFVTLIGMLLGVTTQKIQQNMITNYYSYQNFKKIRSMVSKPDDQQLQLQKTFTINIYFIKKWIERLIKENELKFVEKMNQMGTELKKSNALFANNLFEGHLFHSLSTPNKYVHLCLRKKPRNPDVIQNI